MVQEKEYFAFISYQRKDEEWADRLRSKLEHYRLPSSVRKQNAALPKEIRPIFRDALELAGGVLAKEIETALQNSKFLIVICSPNSAISPWVNKEIQTFIDLGREDKIIPFIIDGIPFSDNAEKECFPPALRSLKGEKELLGININELGRDAAAIKVVARMFDLKFDTLWQRYEREKKRKRWMIIGGALLFAVAATVIASIFFNLNNKLKSTINDRDNALHLADSALIQVRKDSIVLAERLKRITNDSITLAEQKDSIKLQRDEIATERDNVKSANEQTQKHYAKIIVQKANELMDDDDYLTARKLLVSVFPSRNFPYVPEVEAALRRTYDSNSVVLNIETNPSYGRAKAFFSLDGNYVVSSNSATNEIQIWNARTGSFLFRASSAKKNTYFLPIGFKSDGRHLLIENSPVSGKNTIELLDVNNVDGERLSYPFKLKGTILKYKNDFIASVTNPHYLKASSVVYFFNGIEGEVMDSVTILKEDEKVSSIDINSDKWIAAIAYGDTILLRDFRNKRTLTKWKAHENGVRNLNYSHDYNKIVSSEWGMSVNGQKITLDSVKIWDCQKKTMVFGIPCASESVIFSSNGSMIYIIHDSLIEVWDMNIGKMINTYDAKDNIVCADINYKNNKILITQRNGKIRILDEILLNTNYKEIIPFKKPTAIAFSPDGKKIIVGMDSLYIYNVCNDTLENEKKIFTGASLLNPIKSISISPGESLFVATESPWATSVRELDNYAIKSTIYTDASIADINTRRKIIATISYNKVCIWDYSSLSKIDVPTVTLADGEEAKEFTGLCFSSQGDKLLATHRSGFISIWETDGFACIDTIPVSSRLCHNIRYSSDGKYFLCVSGRNIFIFDATTKKTIKSLNGHEKDINIAQFSEDGKMVLSTSLGESILWSIDSGIELKTFDSHGYSAALSPDGSKVITLDCKGRLRIQEFPPFPKLIEETCKWFKDNQQTCDE